VFVNVRWRKRTGHDSSPSDQGRDISIEESGVISEIWFALL
jgi:hypothetical protein